MPLCSPCTKRGDGMIFNPIVVSGGSSASAGWKKVDLNNDLLKTDTILVTVCNPVDGGAVGGNGTFAFCLFGRESEQYTITEYNTDGFWSNFGTGGEVCFDLTSSLDSSENYISSAYAYVTDENGEIITLLEIAVDEDGYVQWFSDWENEIEIFIPA